MKTFCALLMALLAIHASGQTIRISGNGLTPRVQGFQITLSSTPATTACLMAFDGITTTSGAIGLTTATTTLSCPIAEGAATTCTLTLLYGPSSSRMPIAGNPFVSLDIFQLLNPGNFNEPKWAQAQCNTMRANLFGALATVPGLTQAQLAAMQAAVTGAFQATSATFAAQAQAQAQAALQAQLAALQQQQPITH